MPDKASVHAVRMGLQYIKAGGIKQALYWPVGNYGHATAGLENPVQFTQTFLQKKLF